MIFKCKNCGGNVIYSPERRKMYCPYCESEDSEERNDEAQQDINICPNCGGQVPAGAHACALKCPYCDNYLILNERVEGAFEPRLVIPFQFGREACKKRLRDNFKKCLFAPTDFLSEAKLNGMDGEYVPFWLYDYKTHCEYRGEGRNVRIWTTGDTEYTETSIYDIHRSMDIDFSRIPVDASVGMPDDIMDLLEPYGYDQLTDFKPEYLSGFNGEKYNMTSDLVESRARSKMQADSEQLLNATIAGYSSVRQTQKEINAQGVEASYGLLPVWRYQYRYQGKNYPFYINGQTGKIVGKAPLSKKKVLAYGATVWACLTGILSLLYLLPL